MAPKAKRAKEHPKTNPNQKPPSTAQQAPNWPPLRPLLPSSDLFLHTTHPSQILTIPSLLTPTLCKAYVSFLSTLPLVTTPAQPKKGHAVRVNDRFQVEDAAFAARLWAETGLRGIVLEAGETGLWGGEVLGLNPNIRVYRYRKGQFFGAHFDDANTVDLPIEGGAGDASVTVAARTTWTLLVYLTGPSTGCRGGETVFFPERVVVGGGAKGKKALTPVEPIVCELQEGMALLHRHGRDCMLHEGREVLEGEKWVLRSDLCVRR